MLITQPLHTLSMQNTKLVLVLGMRVEIAVFKLLAWTGIPPTGLRTRNVTLNTRILQHDELQWDGITLYTLATSYYLQLQQSHTCNFSPRINCQQSSEPATVMHWPRYKNFKHVHGKKNRCMDASRSTGSVQPPPQTQSVHFKSGYVVPVDLSPPPRQSCVDTIHIFWHGVVIHSPHNSLSFTAWPPLHTPAT